MPKRTPNKEYTDKMNMELVEKEYTNYTVGQDVKINGKDGEEETVGTVTDFNNDRSGNGEQIITIVNDGRNVSPDAPLSERAQVEEITILYRGSTGPDVPIGELFSGRVFEAGSSFIDLLKDWVGNDAYMGNSVGFESEMMRVTGQLEAGSEHLKEIMETYPNARVNLYCHSLGWMVGQYAVANVEDPDRINAVVGSNGPNIFSMLTPEQKKIAMLTSDAVKVYIDKKDPIGLGYGEDKPAIGHIYAFNGKDNYIESIAGGFVKGALLGGGISGGIIGAIGGYFNGLKKQHVFEGYTYDTEGKLLDGSGKLVQEQSELEKGKKIKGTAKSSENQELPKKTLEVDVDQDGKMDAIFDKKKMRPEPLIPKNSSDQIVINYESLSALSTNLGLLLNDIAQIKNLINISKSTNESVESRKQSRTATLEQSIVSYLEEIELIKSITKLDDYYTAIEENKNKFDILSNYSGADFLSNLNRYGGTKSFCYQDGSIMDVWSIAKKLDRVKDGSIILLLSLYEDTLNLVGYDDKTGVPIIGHSISTKTAIAEQGVRTINSFKTDIEETFKGQGVREKFSDGIANPLSEVLKVEEANIDALASCITSMQESVNALANSHKANDATIDENWRANKDVLGNYQVGSIPSDFSTFVQESGLFDDLEVLKAFDQQVDDAANSLSNKMIPAFVSYLETTHNRIKTLYSELKKAQTAADEIILEFPTGIYYRSMEVDNKVYSTAARPNYELSEKIVYYKTVEESIEKSSTIKEVSSFGQEMDEKYDELIGIMYSVSAKLPSLKEKLRDYLEEAIYNYSTLSNVVIAQKMIANVMEKINAQAVMFSNVINENKGKSIEALDGRMKEVATMTSHINQLVTECFGDNQTSN